MANYDNLLKPVLYRKPATDIIKADITCVFTPFMSDYTGWGRVCMF